MLRYVFFHFFFSSRLVSSRFFFFFFLVVAVQGDRRSAGAHGLGLGAFNMDTKYGRLALEKVIYLIDGRGAKGLVEDGAAVGGGAIVSV